MQDSAGPLEEPQAHPSEQTARKEAPEAPEAPDREVLRDKKETLESRQEGTGSLVT